MNLLIVGINPSGKPYRKGCSLYRLNNWMSILGRHYYSFSNVIPYEGDYKMKDVDVNFVSSFCEGYTKVVALGNFASQALKRSGVEHFCMPHPSPLNRKLNDSSYEDMCIQECRQWLRT
jgi:hypothetical protein